MKNIKTPVILCSCLLSFSAQALDCQPAPTCESMGFNKSAADCNGIASIKCPLDQTKLYCSSTPTPSCPTGYLTYDVLYPSCDETDRAKMVEHSSSKGCYQCKKCSEGYWFNPGSCWGSTHSDSSGCKACLECLSSASPVNGRCP